MTLSIWIIIALVLVIAFLIWGFWPRDGGMY